MLQRRQKNSAIIISIIVLLTIFLFFHFTWAQIDTGIDYAGSIGLSKQDPRITIAKVIRVFLGFLGILAVSIIMYGGWLWMTSEGQPDKIDRAKKVLLNAVIGLIIVLSAFGITNFILKMLLQTTGSGGGGGAPSIHFTSGLGLIGNNIIESHYPSRNQTGIPRNTSIIITFREPMNVADLITSNNINSTNILIYKTVDGADGPYIVNVAATSTADLKTFRFKPDEYLGSPSENVWYTVALMGDIHKANGDLAFPGHAGAIAYEWSFEVSTIIDVTPPRIINIIPQPSTTEPRNVVIQINFNEALDPISASGPTNLFDNIVVTNLGDNSVVDGNFYISNEYKTVEFLTNDECGVNSCGNTIYCLPANSNLNVLVKAASLQNIGESFAAFPYDGVVDMASNSLDGNKNGTADGPQSQSGNPPYDENNPDATSQGDDYIWSFSTNNTIDLSAPVIESIDPTAGDTGVDAQIEPEAVFSKYLMSSSLTKNSPPGSGSIALYANPSASEVFYWIGKHNNTVTHKTTVFIKHETFVDGSDYVPEFNSGIKDIYQNCYSPSAGPDGTGGNCIPNPPAQPYCCDGVLSAVSCEP